ncbi:hypothetical protein LEP1GSC037_0671 [Leptospira interrogans str. 2006001854]|uniref:Uncharacterized protein n=1 Tax=Leptospira interrogans str. 2006001854 TaxID=1001590 RepID=M6GHW7_LEPIR|nr:hypothetical protein LEP1GSC037_0671 [Leptospira interrogans str. 2006001854]
MCSFDWVLETSNKMFFIFCSGSPNIDFVQKSDWKMILFVFYSSSHITQHTNELVLAVGTLTNRDLRLNFKIVGTLTNCGFTS